LFVLGSLSQVLLGFLGETLAGLGEGREIILHATAKAWRQSMHQHPFTFTSETAVWAAPTGSLCSFHTRMDDAKILQLVGDPEGHRNVEQGREDSIRWQSFRHATHSLAL